MATNTTYCVHETVGQRAGQVAYVIKAGGDKEALLRLCGHGPEAKRNAEMVCAALNAALAKVNEKLIDEQSAPHNP